VPSWYLRQTVGQHVHHLATRRRYRQVFSLRAKPDGSNSLSTLG
jgi:hypothetical protein